jgi:hypothetical protein
MRNEYICSTRGNWSGVGDGAGDHLAANSITGIIKQQNIIGGDLGVLKPKQIYAHGIHARDSYSI